MAVQAPTSLDDALLRALYFAVHEEEIADLIEQYNTNKKMTVLTKDRQASKNPPLEVNFPLQLKKLDHNTPSTFDPN